jgi:hypothetical protein
MYFFRTFPEPFSIPSSVSLYLPSSHSFIHSFFPVLFLFSLFSSLLQACYLIKPFFSFFLSFLAFLSPSFIFSLFLLSGLFFFRILFFLSLVHQPAILLCWAYDFNKAFLPSLIFFLTLFLSFLLTLFDFCTFLCILFPCFLHFFLRCLFLSFPIFFFH